MTHPLIANYSIMAVLHELRGIKGQKYIHAIFLPFYVLYSVTPE